MRYIFLTGVKYVDWNKIPDSIIIEDEQGNRITSLQELRVYLLRLLWLAS